MEFCNIPDQRLYYALRVAYGKVQLLDRFRAPFTNMELSELDKILLGECRPGCWTHTQRCLYILSLRLQYPNMCL